MLHYGLLVLLSLTIVSSIKAVGIILVIAMLIAPGATAYLLTDRFERMLPIAVLVACSASVLGTFISFHIDGATGACIVLVQAFFFLLAFLFSPKHGLWRPGERRGRPGTPSGSIPGAAEPLAALSGRSDGTLQQVVDKGGRPADQHHAVEGRHGAE
ncbi:MAG: hypothetical protein A49_01800 [Methyloceanibacter sp.]|nr:MAG: hypothetical protein A49_01800 [Methyloceanibacter sp.]